MDWFDEFIICVSEENWIKKFNLRLFFFIVWCRFYVFIVFGLRIDVMDVLFIWFRKLLIIMVVLWIILVSGFEFEDNFFMVLNILFVFVMLSERCWIEVLFVLIVWRCFNWFLFGVLLWDVKIILFVLCLFI